MKYLIQVEYCLLKCDGRPFGPINCAQPFGTFLPQTPEFVQTWPSDPLQSESWKHRPCCTLDNDDEEEAAPDREDVEAARAAKSSADEGTESIGIIAFTI